MPRQAVKRSFQVALKNVEKLCSGVFKVTEHTLTGALVSFFNRHCSCNVDTNDVTVDTYAQLGGGLYYRGSIASPRADSIISNLSHSIQAGGERLGLSGSYLYFIASCPTRVEEGVCRLSSEDSFALGCNDEGDRTNSPRTAYSRTTQREMLNQSVNKDGHFYIIIVLLVVSFLISTLVGVYCCSRHKNKMRGKTSKEKLSLPETTSTDGSEGQESNKSSGRYTQSPNTSVLQRFSHRYSNNMTDTESTILMETGDLVSGISFKVVGSENSHSTTSFSSGTEFCLVNDNNQGPGETKV